MFEILTLKQTGKVNKDIPVVLIGEQFWKTIINWPALIDAGVVQQKEFEEIFFTDSYDEAFRHIAENMRTL